jgi:hypothetical protein
VIVFDFFSGTGSSTQAFVDANHTVISFELDESFEATEHCNIFDLNAKDLIVKYGKPDFVWASPPCTSFSVASIGHHWIPTYGWLMENPRGMLRKLPVVQGHPMRTITYCTYGDKRMKPTDLWGIVNGWVNREPCKNGQGCHEAAPRGSRTGTQGLKGAKDRSRVPYALGKEILDVIEKKDI